jgi:hypothetical protein
MASSKQIPTADSPELGAIELLGVTLSDGVRWEQDGDYIFRSTEFDVIAAGSTFEEGLGLFGTSLIEFAIYLADIEDPAENEVEMLRAIQPRMTKIAARANALLDEAHAAEDTSAKPAPRKRAGTATRSRRSNDHDRRWQPTAKRRNSSRLSLA